MPSPDRTRLVRPTRFHRYGGPDPRPSKRRIEFPSVPHPAQGGGTKLDRPPTRHAAAPRGLVPHRQANHPARADRPPHGESEFVLLSRRRPAGPSRLGPVVVGFDPVHTEVSLSRGDRSPRRPAQNVGVGCTVTGWDMRVEQVAFPIMRQIGQRPNWPSRCSGSRDGAVRSLPSATAIRIRSSKRCKTTDRSRITVPIACGSCSDTKRPTKCCARPRPLFRARSKCCSRSVRTTSCRRRRSRTWPTGSSWSTRPTLLQRTVRPEERR